MSAQLTTPQASSSKLTEIVLWHPRNEIDQHASRSEYHIRPACCRIAPIDPLDETGIVKPADWSSGPKTARLKGASASWPWQMKQKEETGRDTPPGQPQHNTVVTLQS